MRTAIFIFIIYILAVCEQVLVLNGYNAIDPNHIMLIMIGGLCLTQDIIEIIFKK